MRASGGDSPAARLPLASAAADGRRAIAPLAAPRLRGSFLAADEEAVVRTAGPLASDLADLEEAALQPEAPPSLLASHADRALQRAADSGGRLAVAAEQASAARRLWLGAYAHDLRAVDAEATREADALEHWRLRELPAAQEADRWDEMAARVEQAHATRRRLNQRLESLPPPPEARPAAEAYAQVRGHLERALDALRDHAAGRGGSPRPLRVAAEEMAAYHALRERALGLLREAEQRLEVTAWQRS